MGFFHVNIVVSLHHVNVKLVIIVLNHEKIWRLKITGKLAELWGELKETDYDDPKRLDLQKEINKIERYCIDQGYEGFTSITNWNNNSNSTSNIYPWKSGVVYFDDIWMVGSLNGKNIDYNSDGSVHVDNNNTLI